jgi:translation initiation factor 4E
MENTTQMEEHDSTNFHKLNTNWTLWAHLPHDTDWSINSYKRVYNFDYLEESIALCESIPDIMVKNCMLFLMKENIKPTWEDPSNRNGGCFSYKVSNKNVYEIWKKLFYYTVCNQISNNNSFVNNITGITISPKKNFCIIKIWMCDSKYQNPELININSINGLNNNGCLFKIHQPTF